MKKVTDLRDKKNKNPHFEFPTDDRLKPAQRRKLAMQQCACRLCALALNPPKNQEEWDRFVGPSWADKLQIWWDVPSNCNNKITS